MPDIDVFLTRTGWDGALRKPLAGDASRRRYERVLLNDRSAVLMVSPPDIDPSLPRFLEMTEVLRDAGLSAPEIYDADTKAGLALLEDLGDALFARLTSKPSVAEMVSAAVDVILAVGPLGVSAPEPSPSDLQDALTPARDWMDGVDQNAFAEFSSALLPHLEGLDRSPKALSLRDFHGGNLIWRPERAGAARVGLLDYQDAFRVHRTYDLVSLLEDVRLAYPPDAAHSARRKFATAASISEEELDHAYAVLTVQRNTRILGVFSRLALRDGKTGYLDHLGRTYASVHAALGHPDLADARSLFERAVPVPSPTYTQRLRVRCESDPALQ